MIGLRARAAMLVLIVAAAMSGGCASTPDRVTDERPAAAAVVSATNPPSETLSPLLQQALPNIKGRTFTAATVSFPPTARAAPHRHGNAFVYAYVLRGTIISQVAGHPARTYHRGQDWTEQPGADHILTQNASATHPATLLVVFVSHTGDKLKVDDRRR